ncbi:MAG: Leucyl aminopeptidase [Rhodospirillales bacterium]|jgi:leucyl aminopeptidase|nr:Leucyl aminopeptidase [Rhodospirillales bacterium]
MKITFGELALPKSGTVVVGVLEDGVLTPAAAALDTATDGALRRAIAASRFTGKKDELLAILAPAKLPLKRILLAGLGKASAIDAAQMQGLGGAIVANLNSAGETEAAVQLDAIEGAIDPGDGAANLAFGARLRSYRFDRYRTTEKPEKKPTLAKLAILSPGAAAAKRAYARLDKVADGIVFTRDLVSEPANVIYPETLAEQAKSLAALGVTVEVLDEKKMAKLGMGALLGVGQGSARPPRLVVMQWKGNPKSKEAPLAFCGKGVTFDTGGISIKPAAGMEDMKWDMGGAGVVMGLMKALAGRKAKVNAVGLVGLVENMPGANAQRPGDIVKSMSGQTIEVLNTDAEGRLVLADVLWYCQDRFKPRFMIDLATLTGAIIVALGTDYAGLFSNDEPLTQKLVAAGKAVGEKLWQMPLGDSYDRQIDSDAADVKNIGGGREGGSITAAQFIQRFVNKVPWAHLDIAGVTWSKKDSATVPKGATAFGVRLLDRFVADNYES